MASLHARSRSRRSRCSRLWVWFALVAGASGCQSAPDDGLGFDEGSDGAPDPDHSGDDDGGGLDLPPCSLALPGACPSGSRCTYVLDAVDAGTVCVVDAVVHDTWDTCTPAPSTGRDGCPTGHVCLAGQETANTGVCVPLCQSSAGCDGGLCAEDPRTLVDYCGEACSPLVQSCPSTALECLLDAGSFACLVPTDSDELGVGEPCPETDARGCEAGAVCLQGTLVPGCTTASCCTNVCDTTSPAACASPASCNPLPIAAQPGLENVGACFVAQ
jgi:hypothetical protein